MNRLVEQRRYCLHGASISIRSSHSPVRCEIDRLLGSFATTRAARSREARGIVKSFDLPEISRRVSPLATPVPTSDGLIELYALEDRYWLVDERWGICEIDLLKQQWRSWILPKPKLDLPACAAAAVLWPAAQLLRIRPGGLTLLPAISIERDGWGALVIAPYSIRAEIERLILAGYRVIGPRWTGLGRRGQGLDLLPMLGALEISAQSASPPAGSFSGNETDGVDLLANKFGPVSKGVPCRAVFIILPGRRSNTLGQVAGPEAAAGLLRRYWPICDLPNHRRRLSDAVSVLARECCCVSVELSRNIDAFLKLVNSVCGGATAHKSTPPKPARLQVTVNPYLPKQNKIGRQKDTSLATAVA